MKQTIFTLLFIITIGFISCRKDGTDQTIRQYDDAQIQSYISTNGLTGMSKDTSGMYYKILSNGSGAPLNYSDSVSFVYTVKTFDGQYAYTDTLINHYSGYLGRVSNGLPLALQTAIYEFLKYRDGSMRVLVPSRLGYGTSGAGSGSSSVTNNKINGNQSLDYYIHTIKDQKAYDDQVITKFLAAKGLTSQYQKVTTGKYAGLYYKTLTPGTGTLPINDNTTLTANYSQFLLSGTLFNEYNIDGGTTIDFPDMIAGLQGGLRGLTAGANMSFIMPSHLAYGKTKVSNVPANSCIQYEIRIIEVSR